MHVAIGFSVFDGDHPYGMCELCFLPILGAAGHAAVAVHENACVLPITGLINMSL
jgi:hypothetical protein